MFESIKKQVVDNLGLDTTICNRAVIQAEVNKVAAEISYRPISNQELCELSLHIYNENLPNY